MTRPAKSVTSLIGMLIFEESFCSLFLSFSHAFVIFLGLLSWYEFLWIKICRQVHRVPQNLPVKSIRAFRKKQNIIIGFLFNNGIDIASKKFGFPLRK